MITSYRWPIPIETTSVVYGLIGTKSAEITVIVWLSREILKKVSVAILMNLRRYFFPGLNSVRKRFPPPTQLVSVLDEQSNTFVPLISPFTAG